MKGGTGVSGASTVRRARTGLRRLAIAVAVASVLAGCSSGAGSQWAGNVEVRDGVPWVTNPADPLWPAGEPRLRLHLEQVFGVDEDPPEAMLAAVRGIAVDAAGTVYVLDASDNRLVAFDSSGNVLWSASREGEGPGEMDRPRALAWDGAGRLYLLNQSGTLIDVWSTRGEYVDSHRLPELDVFSGSTFGFISEGTLALVPSGPAPEVQLLEVRPEWRRRGSFSIDAGGATLAGARLNGETRVVSGILTTGNAMDYAFRVHDSSGQLVRVVTRPDTGFVPAAVDAERMAIGSLGDLQPPLWLPDGYWLAQAHWPTNVEDPLVWLREAMAGRRPGLKNRWVLDLFDAEGRWLTNRTWDHPDTPGFGTLEAIGPDGKLYTSVRDPYPHVRRYRIDLAR